MTMLSPARTRQIQGTRAAAARALLRGGPSSVGTDSLDPRVRDQIVVARETHRGGAHARAQAGRDVGHAERVLYEVTALCTSDRVDDALDHLLCVVDAWLDEGHVRRCDLLCELMPLDRVDDAVPLALLGATIEHKLRLHHRETLTARLEAHLRLRHAASEVDAMLWGLR